MNSWIQLPKDVDCMPKARWGHSMTKLSHRLLVMFGGYAGNIKI